MITMEKKNGNTKGFTLVELIMVIVIIGLLAAIVVPRFGGQADDARIASTQANLANLRSAVEVYNLQEGAMPIDLDDLHDGTSPSGDTYIRVIPEENLGQGVLPSNNVALSGSPAACANAGGWIYVNAGADMGEVRVNRDATACPAGSTCNPDNPCIDW